MIIAGYWLVKKVHMENSHWVFVDTIYLANFVFEYLRCFQVSLFATERGKFKTQHQNFREGVKCFFGRPFPNLFTHPGVFVRFGKTKGEIWVEKGDFRGNLEGF